MFFSNYFSRNVVWSQEFWVRSCYVYCNVFQSFNVSRISNDNIDMVVMVISCQSFVFNVLNVMDVDVFINFCNKSNMSFFELCLQFFYRGFRSESSVSNLVSKCYEVVVFCYEVSLVVDFNQSCNVFVFFDYDGVFSSDVVSFFSSFSSIIFMYVFDCQFDVIVGFNKGFFIFYYICVSMFVQFFYQSSSNSYFLFFS